MQKKKKKIGIITYWESNDNYGQQLQCWALQQYLRLHDYNAFLIRQYVWPPQKKCGIKRIKQWTKDIIASLFYATGLAYVPMINKHFAFCLNKEACRRKFPKFRRNYLHMSKVYNSPEKLKHNPPKADIYITGSDQVWNYTMPKEVLSNFFLQFGKEHVKRIAYAPSIGNVGFPEEIKDTIKSYLKDFSAISVRELSAVSVINELGYEASHVLDPTMLLQMKDYLRLAKGIIVKPSVFIYSINYTSEQDIPFQQIQSFAQEHVLPIVVTPGSGYVPAKELFDGVEYSYASIPKWIQHIAMAELVVTPSFHGIIFSILFHRPFIYTPIKGKHESSNVRVLDLLEELNLNERIWRDNGLSLKAFVDKRIDWEGVDYRLKELRESSVNYLERALVF